MPRLTATSYAMLGLLAIRPLSAHELVKRMDAGGMRQIWPRAASKLYEEPKKLVGHGCAVSRDAPDGERPRTVYEITPAGRRTLNAWLDADGTPLALEFEQMLKVFFADLGTREQLMRRIDRIREDIGVASLDLAAACEGTPDDPLPLGEHAHVAALVDRFVIDMLQAVLGWADWAETIVSAWPGTTPTPSIEAQTEQLRRRNTESLALMATAGRKRHHG
jgi:DNA-binding PadR family transcriptional regulator